MRHRGKFRRGRKGRGKRLRSYRMQRGGIRL